MHMAIIRLYTALASCALSPNIDASPAIRVYCLFSLLRSLTGTPRSRLRIPMFSQTSTLSFKRRRICSSISSILFLNFDTFSNLFLLLQNFRYDACPKHMISQDSCNRRFDNRNSFRHDTWIVSAPDLNQRFFHFWQIDAPLFF